MITRALVAAAILTACIGPACIGPAVAQTTGAGKSPADTPPGATSPSNTTSATNPQTIGSGSAATQDPTINPSAAGTQLKHPTTTSPSGPSTAQPAYALKPSDKTSYSADQAREIIEKQGYTSVTGLRKDTNAIWEGTAMHNGRQVRVGVDSSGTVAELR